MSRKAIVFFTIFLFVLFIPIIVYSQGTSFQTAERLTGSKYNIRISYSQRYHYYIYYVQAVNTTICIVPKSSTLDVDLRIYYTNNLTWFASSTNPMGQIDCVVLLNRHGRDYYIEVYLYYSREDAGHYDLLIYENGVLVTQQTTQQQQTQQVNIAGCNCQTACRDCGITGGDWWQQIQSAFNPARWGACLCCHVACPIAEFFNNLQRMIAGIVESITGFFQGIVNSIMNFFNSIREFFTNIANAIMSFFTSIRDWIVNMVNGFVQLMQGIAQSIVNFFAGIGEMLASLPAAIMRFFSSFAETVSRALAPVGAGAAEALGGAGAWLGRNWPYLIGVFLIGLGFFTKGVLSVVGVLIIVGYMLTVGDLDWRMVILVIGAIITIFALKER